MEGVPVQLLADGVTVIVAIIGKLPAFVAVNEGTSPIPFVPKPIAVLLFVHAKVVPGVVLVKAVVGTNTPLHTEKFAGTITVAVGFTVIV